MSLNRVLLWSQRRGSNDQFYYMREDVMYILERRKWDEITGIIGQLFQFCYFYKGFIWDERATLSHGPFP